jgi:hypothetical protein
MNRKIDSEQLKYDKPTKRPLVVRLPSRIHFHSFLSFFCPDT